MLAVLIVSTVIYAGSLGVEMRQECFQMIEEQEERIRQIVAAKQIRERTDFVMTTSRGTTFQFGEHYGMRTIPRANAAGSDCDGRNRRGDSAVAIPEIGSGRYLDRLLYAVHGLFGEPAEQSGISLDAWPVTGRF